MVSLSRFLLVSLSEVLKCPPGRLWWWKWSEQLSLIDHNQDLFVFGKKIPSCSLSLFTDDQENVFDRDEDDRHWMNWLGLRFHSGPREMNRTVCLSLDLIIFEEISQRREAIVSSISIVHSPETFAECKEGFQIRSILPSSSLPFQFVCRSNDLMSDHPFFSSALTSPKRRPGAFSMMLSHLALFLAKSPLRVFALIFAPKESSMTRGGWLLFRFVLSSSSSPWRSAD